ncbi:hypothetical protein E3T54_02795 [Cryobacterium sp. Sr8]|uniref:hypothetical protein n=1 Tax=Cryobacterium sp. Sr8 TaxID=1259203 RepID=UPI00106C024C|nr:hypothetical protein [Cryobacterium sp. Sr8]TFD80687.1 hypothetical protein E3T54_02795 [Cryobacterium sp. Sr8]
MVIEPHDPWPPYANDNPTEREDRLIAIATQIARDCERHVDDLDAAVAYDRVTVCSFCDHEWEVITKAGASDDEPEGLPVCCAAAQKEWFAGARA